MQISHLFAGVAVTDFAAACEWYERPSVGLQTCFRVEVDQVRSNPAAARSVVVSDADGNTITLFEEPARRSE